jgi:hypothetical protein
MTDPWTRGEFIAGITIPYNVLVEVTSGPAKGVRGWTVAVDPRLDEPLYTVEREDREGDIEVLQSCLRVVS